MRITYIGTGGNRKHFDVDPNKVDYVIVDDDSMLIVNDDLSTEYIKRYNQYGWDETTEEFHRQNQRWRFKCKLDRIVNTIRNRRTKKLE